MEIHRRTKQVQSLLDFFEKQTSAVSTSILLSEFKGQMNRTTVYRILVRMEEDGIIHSFKGPNGATWYAKCKECGHHDHHDIHPHFQCNKCGKVECIDISLEIPSIPNYEIEQQEVLLKGECEECHS